MSIVPQNHCGSGCNESAGCDCNGNIYPCHRFVSVPDSEKFIIGNVFTGMDDQKRKHIEDDMLTKEVCGSHCSNCMVSKTCDGLCFAENYEHDRNLFNVAPVSCWWRMACAREALRIMNTLGDEHNEKFRDSFLRCLSGDAVWQ